MFTAVCVDDTLHTYEQLYVALRHACDEKRARLFPAPQRRKLTSKCDKCSEPLEAGKSRCEFHQTYTTSYLKRCTCKGGVPGISCHC